MTTTPTTFWWPAGPPSEDVIDVDIDVDCICIGTGRFLRSGLVPPLVAAGFRPALIQTRGTSFIEFMTMMQTQNSSSSSSSNSYPVDVVHYDGSLATEDIPCYGAFSWGSVKHKQAVEEELLNKMKRFVLFWCIFLRDISAVLKRHPLTPSCIKLIFHYK